jgi:hypothetical protein
MNNRVLLRLLVGLCLAGLAAACGATPPPSTTNPPLSATTSPIIPSVSTSAATIANSAMGTASSSPALGWSTFTNPQGLYSIQYPDSLGPPGIADEGTLFWNTPEVPDFEVDISNNVIPTKTFRQWLVKSTGWASARPDETSIVNDMQAFFYGTDKSHSVPYTDIEVFLLYPLTTRTGSSQSMVFNLSFSCNLGEVPCSVPAYWRQMLTSFHPLLINH